MRAGAPPGARRTRHPDFDPTHQAGRGQVVDGERQRLHPSRFFT